MKSYCVIFLLLIFYISVDAYAESCPSGTYSVKVHPRQAYYRNDGTYVSETTVSSYCKNYRNDGSLKLQFLHKFPKGWPQKREQFKKCSKKKQSKINKTLTELPSILTNIGNLKVHCATKSIYPANPAASAPVAKIIVLYDSAFVGDPKKYIAHELAHILYDRLSDEEKKLYREASGWKKDGDQYRTKRKKFSAPDGASDPDEDFSNNIESFLLENKTFEKKYPKISKWIKKIFGDKK